MSTTLNNVFSRLGIGRRDDVRVPMARMNDIFQLNSHIHRHCPELMMPLCLSLNFNYAQREGTMRAFQVNPNERGSLPTSGPQVFADDGTRDYPRFTYPASPLVAWHDFRSGDKHALGIMIRPKLLSGSAGPGRVIAFGMTGLIDDESNEFIVKKIIIPTFNNGRVPSGAFHPVITPNNVDVALAYASVCTRQIFAREPFDMYANLRIAESAQNPETLITQSIAKIKGYEP